MSAGVKHAEDCQCRECIAQRNEPVTDSCSCCKKRRKCKIDVAMSRDPLTGKVPTWAPRYCVAECLALGADARRARRKEVEENRREKAPPLAWPIIGGPLDGKYAVPADFYEESGKPGQTWYREGGRYAEHARKYAEFNAGHGGNKRIGGFPTMVFIHTSLCLPLIRGRDR